MLKCEARQETESFIKSKFLPIEHLQSYKIRQVEELLSTRSRGKFAFSKQSFPGTYKRNHFQTETMNWLMV